MCLCRFRVTDNVRSLGEGKKGLSVILIWPFFLSPNDQLCVVTLFIISFFFCNGVGRTTPYIFSIQLYSMKLLFIALSKPAKRSQ